MRTKLTIIAVLLFVVLSLGATTIDWLNNIEDALQIAKKSDKHVFVFFTGSDWCSWCDRLISEVYNEKEFQEYVNKNMVMVLLDYPRSDIIPKDQKEYNSIQQQKYNIQGYPSVIVLNADGKVALQTGYREGGAYKYVEFLKGSLNWKFDASNATWEDGQGLIWQKNLELAKKLAKKDNKSLFINFTGSDWCVWCHRLTDEVFSQPEFVDFAHNNLVLVRFDFPKQTEQPAGEENYNRKMAQKYGVKGFPTLFLTDSSGSIIQKLGYEKGGAVPYTDMLRDLIN